MPEQRRRFSPQSRAEAVQMVLETGKSIAEVARDLGINEGTLGNWVDPRLPRRVIPRQSEQYERCL
jgi:transposase-like protein